MAGKSFIPPRNLNPGMRLSWEKALLLKNFTFVNVTISELTLKCVGECQPTDVSIKYIYEVRFSPGRPPAVFTIEPRIKYHPDIHIYPQDNSLCLYYPKDFSWRNDSHLYNTIIPWTHEWFVYYELYQIKGKWDHPFVSHGQSKIKQ